MSIINDFSVVGVVEEGGSSYLQFVIETTFSPETTSFSINVGLGALGQFNGQVSKSYTDIWGNSGGYGVIEPVSDNKYSINFELPDAFTFPAEPIDQIIVNANENSSGEYAELILSKTNGNLPGGGLLTLNGESQNNVNQGYSGPTVSSLSFEETALNGRIIPNYL